MTGRKPLKGLSAIMPVQISRVLHAHEIVLEEARTMARSSRVVSNPVRPMVQSANDPGLLTNLQTVERVLNEHASVLAHDRIGYRNHVYRVVNLCLAVAGDN